ncbi:hypothetical protein BD779DRAFT_1460543, partial [Infundibulicybe gibba]
MVKFTQKTMPTNHKTRKNCACTSCRTDRNNGCENPTKCRQKAASMLNNLPPKWNPSINPVENAVPNQLAIDQVRFEKDVTTRGDLKEGFRVFTDPTT